jgi:Skp family chaperone for outer membrane proteins
MRFQNYVRCVGALAAGAAALGVLAVPGGAVLSPVQAEDAAPASAVAAVTSGFGSVDMQKCAQEAKQRQDLEDQWNAYEDLLEKSIQRLGGGSARFLSEAQIRELAAIYEKDEPSSADLKRRDDLEQMADGFSAEMAKIQQNPTPTDVDNKRLQELTASKQAGEKVLHSLQDDYQTRAAKRRDELVTKLTAQIRDAVGKVAKTKGLTVVFDASVAVYTQNDITAEVIKTLNK